MREVRRKLEGRLTVRLAIAVGISMIFGYAGVWWVHVEHADKLIHESLVLAAHTVAESIRHEMLEGRPEEARLRLGGYADHPPIEAIRIHAPDGRVFLSTRAGEAGRRLEGDGGWTGLVERASERHAPRVFPLEGRRAGAMIALTNDAECRRCHADGPAVAGYVAITASLARSDELISRARLALMATGGAVGVALVLGLRKLLQGFVVRRLERIGGVLDGARAGNLELRVGDAGPDEIGRLADRVDELLAALGRAQRENVEHLENLDRRSMIGQLTGGILHEVKSGLGAACAAAQVLRGPGLDEATRGECLAALEEELRRLDRILDRLLAFGRPGRSAPGPVDVNAAVETALELFERTAPSLKFEVRPRLKGGLPPTYGDRELLEQVFLNLFVNAHEARPKGLVLEVETQLLRGRPEAADTAPFDLRARRDAIQVVVTDNGPGLPERVRARLFDAAVTSKPDGSGLGLYVSHRILAQQGGTIDAQTAPRGGTVFRIVLPVDRGGRPAAPAGGDSGAISATVGALATR